LIAINSQKMYTLQVGLSQLTSQAIGTDWGGVMTGAAIASIPMLIVFLFFQKYIVKVVSISSLKG
jgi:multiple sugar transport system permease protein